VKRPPFHPDRRAFTIVEILVVVGVIAVLVSILLVSFRGVRRGAEAASAQRLMATVGQAVETFERDFAYLPPLLVLDAPAGSRVPLGNSAGALMEPSVVVPQAKWPDASQASSLRAELEATRYGSEYTLGVYLLGAGDIDNSEVGAATTIGRNDANDDGLAGPGIRDPGPDRSWGGAASRAAQNSGRTAIKTGRTYGPYLDPAGLADRVRLDPATGLFKLTDSWDQPIRYYTGWPVLDRPSSGAPKPSIDFTPVELRDAGAVEAHLLPESGTGPDLERERAVLTAPFAVLSAGPAQFYDSDNRPIPLFGDRDRVGSPPTSLDTLMSNQDLGQAFDPSLFVQGGDLNPRGRALIDDLTSNVRYVP
jgi:type II secretory pathway pseudopilin PulG